MVYGYARVSTLNQAKEGNSLKIQEESLKKAGAEKVYSDVYSGTSSERPKLNALLGEIKSGDTLIITRLDRIARNAVNGFELVQKLLNDNITVNVLNMGIMDNSPTGVLVTQMMLAYAEFERNITVERIQEGKRKARESGRLIEGRPKKYTAKQIEHALSLCETLPVSEVVQLTGISRSTLFRAKSKKKELEESK